MIKAVAIFMMFIVGILAGSWWYFHPVKTVAFDNRYGIGKGEIPVRYHLNGGPEVKDVAHCEASDCKVKMRLVRRAKNRIQMAVERDGEVSTLSEVILEFK